MEINNKFNVGDAIWFIKEDKVKHQKIIGMEITIRNVTNIWYLTDGYLVKQDDAFATKQELVESL